MTQFDALIKSLNQAQLRAVKTIEGPVLVIAGPGTGKTQLLSMRAANIVKSTDATPGSILCLTFTESAAVAMQQRLLKVMGSEGNKVAVHTFHSFGTEVINHNPEYFYGNANFSPADDVTNYEILQDIFSDLPHSNPFAKTLNGDFIAIKDAQSAISHLKKAGLSPDELVKVLDQNQSFCDSTEKLVVDFFADRRLSKKDIPSVGELLQKISAVNAEKPGKLFGFSPLAEVFMNTFKIALKAAEQTGKTTSLTAWRNSWCEKDGQGKLVLKERKVNKKLRALAKIYESYREKMLQHKLFDFDDMVSNVVHTIESNPELKFSLQEQYQYIMVDEFQDTNGAQMRLLNALADNPVNEGRPNILAVGDDDQAIYAFQGAELSNIIEFVNKWRNVEVITLTENYRSTKEILEHSRKVISQGQNRLENIIEDVNKNLNSNFGHKSTTVSHVFNSPSFELSWVAKQIASTIAEGSNPSEIAVLARNHKQLMSLVPYLRTNNVSVAYEKRDNILQQSQIREILNLAETVTHLSDQQFDLVEAHLPELLSYDFWGLKTADLWRLSLAAHKQRRMWLEIMLESDGKLHEIAKFLVVASHQSLHEPLDIMLDILIGTQEVQAPNEGTDSDPEARPITEDYSSPFRDFYFNQDQLQQNPASYLGLLANLRALKRAVKNFRPQLPNIKLADLVDMVDVYKNTGTQILSSQQLSENDSAINLMTTHKAKGLEFESVFVINSQDSIWGRKARRPHSQVGFPHNLPIKPAGNSYDDSLKLFFVAMTRAKHTLHLTWHSSDENNKTASQAEFLVDNTLTQQVHNIEEDNLEHNEPNISWERKWFDFKKSSHTELLAPSLQNYRLSATHLNNFIDITRGGPQAFLLQNLLRFPQAMTTSQVFGQAIHAVLQRAHTHLNATGELRPIEDILHDFELQLQRARLSEKTTDQLLEKGSEVLNNYLKQKHSSFNQNQKAEVNFYSQNVTLGDIRLTGAIDVMEINKKDKTITVIDYKTGKGQSSWLGRVDYEKIKLHKYKQQLMFYKLLVENSRDFNQFTVTKGVLEFVEPGDNDNLLRLETDFNQPDLDVFKKLLAAVWQKITVLDFIDTSSYDQNYKGVMEFEQDLIKDK